MENGPLMAEIISFPNKLNWVPLESISGSDGVSMEEERNGLLGLLQNGEPDLNTSAMRENNFIELEKKTDSLKPWDDDRDPSGKIEDSHRSEISY